MDMPSPNDPNPIHEQLQLATHREKVQMAVSSCFEKARGLQSALAETLKWLLESGPFRCGEIWVVNDEESNIHLTNTLALDPESEQFYQESSDVTTFKRGEGVPGHIWLSQENECWNGIDEDPRFLRHRAASKTGMRGAFGVPLFQSGTITGVLLLLSDRSLDPTSIDIRGMRDLGELLGTEIRRKQQEEQMLLLFESSPDIMGIASPNGYFRKVNPAFCNLLGYTEEEICSRPFQEFIHPEDRTRTLSEFDDTKTGRRHAKGFVNRYVTRDGDVRYLSWGSSDAFGLDRYVFAYGRDVTEQVQHERSLVELNHRLQLSNDELEQFAYIASHDLQEPLRMISSFMALLDRNYGEQLDEKAREYIHYAVEGGQRMRDLLLDLLEFSRTGSSGDRVERIPLGYLVEETKELLRREMDERNATLSYDTLPHVYTSRAPMIQILQNLIGNALKYSREGVPPDIRIEAESDSQCWTLRVHDNGIGIEPEYHERIFTLFQRLHQREEYEGTGIGLAIVKKITDRFNGTIQVDSTPGSGSTFTLVFPHHPASPTDRPVQPDTTAP